MGILVLQAYHQINQMIFQLKENCLDSISKHFRTIKEKNYQEM